MGIIDFARDAGSSILSVGEEAQVAVALANDSHDGSVLSRLRSDAEERLLRQVDLRASPSVSVAFDVVQGRVTLTGTVSSQCAREKLVLLMGNHQGVGQVVDRLVVSVSSSSSWFYTVVKGDTLPKIARATYGDPLAYSVIFEANRPMLKSPDLIYPGQVLRIT